MFVQCEVFYLTQGIEILVMEQHPIPFFSSSLPKDERLLLKLKNMLIISAINSLHIKLLEPYIVITFV